MNRDVCRSFGWWVLDFTQRKKHSVILSGASIEALINQNKGIHLRLLLVFAYSSKEKKLILNKKRSLRLIIIATRVRTV